MAALYLFVPWLLPNTRCMCHNTDNVSSLIHEKYFEEFFVSRIICTDSICVACIRNKMWPLLLLWDTSLISVFIPTLTVILIFVLTINIIKYLTPDLHIQIRDTSKQHNWHNGKLLSKVSDVHVGCTAHAGRIWCGMLNALFEIRSIFVLLIRWGSVVVKALRYKPEGRGFDTQWGVYSASNRNEYQKY
jgi:hypothetical protein